MEIDRNLLVCYFLGQCTEDEKRAIQQWLENDEVHKKQFIHERIRFDASLMMDEQTILPKKTDHRLQIKRYALRIAATILILIGSSYLFSLFRTDKPDIVIQTIHVPAGNRTSLTLPDGTQVWLNSNTTLRYPNLFTGKERNVELDGEAYFEVVKNGNQPFVVKTGPYNVEVLGTSFNVEAYAEKANFKTALFTGKVKIYKEQSEENELYLNAGETVELANNTLVVTTENLNNYRWKDGLIIIEDKSFEEIMHLFEKYYGQHIIIRNDKVKQLGYRGKLRIADGVDHALRVLQKDFSFTYQREEDTDMIYIY